MEKEQIEEALFTEVTMSKQTSVQLLIQEIEKDQTTKAKSMFEWNKVFHQLLEMNKQEIIDAYDCGRYGCIKGEQFYNETYGK